MSALSKKLLVAGLVVGAAVGYLAYAGAKQGWVYYVSVDQFAQDATKHTQRVRLMGNVAEGDYEMSPSRTSVKFLVVGTTARIPVQFRGAIPDLFKPGVEVVVEGKLNSAGVFVADTLLTKCASKYDSKHPETAKPQEK